MKTLRSLLGLLVVAAAVYVAWQLVPVYYANYQLEEVMEDTAREATINRMRTEQDVRERVMKQASDLQIPLSPERLQVEHGNGDTRVWGDYTVHVDLPGYPLDLHFQPASKSKKRSM